MSKPDPFAEFVAARKSAGQLTEFLPRADAGDLVRTFLTGRMTTNELVGLTLQPRSSNHPAPSTGVAGVREVAESYRRMGWTKVADEFDAIAAEAEAILNT